MIGTSKRNSSPVALRPITGEGALSSASHTQFDKCELCKAPLDIGVGTLTIVRDGVRTDRSGVLVERCTNVACKNSVPHQHKPTTEQPSEGAHRPIGPAPKKVRPGTRRGPLETRPKKEEGRRHFRSGRLGGSGEAG